MALLTLGMLAEAAISRAIFSCLSSVVPLMICLPSHPACHRCV
jgi:hypothetical protein